MRGALLSMVTLTVAWMGPTRAGGQDATGARGMSVGAMAVGVVTSASPVYVGRRFTEGYLTQPNLMGDAWYRAGDATLRFTGTLNGEGYTLDRGELNAGIYGEGYIDRRHPHTLLHEAMLGATSPAAKLLGTAWRLSLAAGKGFTPFGTDDPMMRPFVKYPVNHHHAQIIERAVVIGGIAAGNPADATGVALEYGVFNGDEPVTPFSSPQWQRVGDSHAVRATVAVSADAQFEASHAFVRSPGIVQGGAFDHRQSSVAARWMSHARDARVQYGMLEVARTDEGIGGDRVFRYESVLAEGAVRAAGATLALRLESTERPESLRLLDPFRIASGHIDFQILGVTRWRVATIHLQHDSVSGLRIPGTRLMPFLEVAAANAAARRRPSVFEPREFYGSANQFSVSVGVRVHAGRMRERMGRYGVLAPRPTHTMHDMSGM